MHWYPEVIIPENKKNPLHIDTILLPARIIPKARGCHLDHRSVYHKNQELSSLRAAITVADIRGIPVMQAVGQVTTQADILLLFQDPGQGVEITGMIIIGDPLPG